MENQNQDPTSDRRDVEKQGSSLSGSTMRDNISSDRALHPENSTQQDEEVVDQDPGERQKENQNDSKDDPLAA
jgi:hypothetical protein